MRDCNFNKIVIKLLISFSCWYVDAKWLHNRRSFLKWNNKLALYIQGTGCKCYRASGAPPYHCIGIQLVHRVFNVVGGRFELLEPKPHRRTAMGAVLSIHHHGLHSDQFVLHLLNIILNVHRSWTLSEAAWPSMPTTLCTTALMATANGPRSLSHTHCHWCYFSCAQEREGACILIAQRWCALLYIYRSVSWSGAFALIPGV